MKLRFKPAENHEIKDALSFFKAASQMLKKKNLSQWQYWDDPPGDKIAWIQEGFDKEEFFFVYATGTEKIAMFRLLETDTLYWGQKGLEKNTRYVHSLVVSQNASGKGIGKTILQELVAGFKKSEVKKFRLDCDASNKQLCQYYEGFGFKKVGVKQTNFATNNLYEMRLTSA